uniref:Uncharacterized protein n=1 Tax=Romanomermis culicivorax TaxID=13658 RepID=A0A915JYS6_ROMCU
MHAAAVLSWSNALHALIRKLCTSLAFAIARLLWWLFAEAGVVAGACGGSILIKESEESVLATVWSLLTWAAVLGEGICDTAGALGQTMAPMRGF